MPRAAFLAFVFVQLGLCDALLAQVSSNNPYAQKNEPPVSADGTLNWGTFYKSAALEARYQQLWQMGACRGTNPRIEGPVAQNKLDVNKLPEGSVAGQVVKVGGGLLVIKDKDKREITVVLHPAGVTKVQLTGPMPASALKKGTTVRFEAKVDQHGRSEEPLVKLDVITPDKSAKPATIRPNLPAIVVGQVIDIHNKLLRVKVQSGAITRVVLPLEENAVANLEVSDISLSAAGDTVEAKGHLWEGDGSKNGPAVFASDVILKRPLSPSSEAVSQANFQ